ncbi:hypothetical protein EDC96DRAFT_545450 [Choanephora cucurbitarum]|nr:hypothetical protein EDC96DRAFT_545450 [Choanephora cucurbitarum]
MSKTKVFDLVYMVDGPVSLVFFLKLFIPAHKMDKCLEARGVIFEMSDRNGRIDVVHKKKQATVVCYFCPNRKNKLAYSFALYVYKHNLRRLLNGYEIKQKMKREYDLKSLLTYGLIHHGFDYLRR